MKSEPEFVQMCRLYLQGFWFDRGEIWTPTTYLEMHDRLTRIARACGYTHTPVFKKGHWFMMSNGPHPSFMIKRLK